MDQPGSLVWTVLDCQCWLGQHLAGHLGAYFTTCDKQGRRKPIKSGRAKAPPDPPILTPLVINIFCCLRLNSKFPKFQISEVTFSPNEGSNEDTKCPQRA